MPVEDGCLTEESALENAWREAEEICNLALEALMSWVEARMNAWDDCSYLGILGGGLTPYIDEFGWRDQINQDIEECISGHPDVIDAWNLYLDLEAECAIAREEAMALQDEYKACIHALHEGIPFA